MRYHTYKILSKTAGILFLSAIFIFFPSGLTHAQGASCTNFSTASYSVTGGMGKNFEINRAVGTSLVIRAAGESKGAVIDSDFVLVIDNSSSMTAKDGTAFSRLERAKQAMTSVVDNVAKKVAESEGSLRVRIGLVTFSKTARIVQGVTNDYDALKVAIAKIAPESSTTVGGGLLAGAVALKDAGYDPAIKRFIILASDGQQNTAPSVAIGIAAVPADVTIYTIGIGRDADTKTLGTISTTAGDGKGTMSPNQIDLTSIYQQILGQILGSFVLDNISISFSRDNMRNLDFASASPTGGTYDTRSGIVKWDNIGAIGNAQEKELTISYTTRNAGANIPLNLPNLVAKYTLGGVSCTESVPVNVLSINIVDNPPIACTDMAWSPSPNTFCTTQTFAQTSNCGNVRTNIRGTKACSQCSDFVDNDNDGKTDYPKDPGCFSPQDNLEFNLYSIFEF